MLLLHMYINQSLFVRWVDVCSEPFTVSNGVKQGGVLSPVLFCLYMDELLTRLVNSGVGCRIGHWFVGPFGYADDSSLLAPSCNGIRRMLQICTEFAAEYSLKFNSKKTVLLVYNASKQSNIQLYMDNSLLVQSDQASHLGCTIGSNIAAGNKSNVDKAINDLVYRTNILMSRFGHCTTSVRLSLFDAFCTSYYGSPLWKLSVQDIDPFCVTWRKCMRRILKLDCRMRSKYIPIVIDKPNIRTQLLCRFTNFWFKCFTSDNPIVHLCSKLSCFGGSIVACNLREVLSCVTFGLNHVLSLECDAKIIVERLYEKEMSDRSDADSAVCAVISELCECRDQVSECNLSLSDINDMLLQLAVT